ncbi:hypothetical protein D8674_010742 [Pyrus ussuriensis x Pyrus communis]|uniref:Ankyrin repeat domain-containing protein n=1 Tax=Pyrus ussuriensis x Pyrus communis TaxID=2448454 RepID=A0A5N5FF73_9ROSA|nr:hypothetical protein D8674_010742 [Pyrus ussuriensis x Pyrus communis]
MAGIVVSKYDHSPVHKAIVTRDYAGLRRILAGLPWLGDPAEIRTESASLAEEEKADAIAAVIDRRDVRNRETPLHLAVKLGDQKVTEMLMEHGWSALQEAICNREEAISMIIVRHYRPLAWAKWCRRLPRLIGTMRSMRDFYMEITFDFESSVIPFISRIAPSDTYKIWKLGANLRADMTLAGFDGLRIQCSDQSVLFLSDESDDGMVPPGSLCMISHKDKEVMNALDGAGSQATEEEVRQEMVAIPQGMTDDELFSSCNENETEREQFNDILTEDETRQPENALKLDSSELSNENGDEIIEHRYSCYDHREIPIEDVSSGRNGENKQEKKGWFGGWRKWGTKNEGQKKIVPPEVLCVDEKVSDQSRKSNVDIIVKGDDHRRGRDMNASYSTSSDKRNRHKGASKENEYKKGSRPILWLSPNFPLQTEELLLLLDILANKVKAIHRLRELLTTKLPMGTFPVKVAIPVVRTIRVIVMFTKLEELAPMDEFATPPSSPPEGRAQVRCNRQVSSWFQWIKAPYQRSSSSATGSFSMIESIQDPFAIPSEYAWVSVEAKKKKMRRRTNQKGEKSESPKMR